MHLSWDLKRLSGEWIEASGSKMGPRFDHLRDVSWMSKAGAGNLTTMIGQRDRFGAPRPISSIARQPLNIQPPHCAKPAPCPPRADRLPLEQVPCFYPKEQPAYCRRRGLTL